MTARELYRTALQLIFEEEAGLTEYERQVPAVLTAMLPETFGLNNILRVRRGLEPLARPPIVGGLEEEILYEEALSRAALPFGLAANLLLGDEEENRAASLFAKYAEAVNYAAVAIPAAIRDVY